MYSCPAPKAAIDAPRNEVPNLACDCHAHILGPLDAYPYVENRGFTPPPAGVPEYLRMAGTLGLARTVIVQPSVYGADNRRTVSAVAEIGRDRARGVVMVEHDVSRRELRRLDEAGARATRFITTVAGGPTLDQLPDVARKVADFGWHIEMYVPPAVWPEILPVVAALPVPVVFDHVGSFTAATRDDDDSYKRVLDIVASGRGWVKLCGYRASVRGYPYGDAGALVRRFLDAAPDRCVWGTDWPHFMMKDVMPGDEELYDLFADWVPDPALRRRVLVENPAELYRF